MTFIDAAIFILGTIAGSFLNVCIVRMPHEKSVIYPSSHCPECQKPVMWYDNVPLLSYILLQGRCRNCHKSFSARYFFVELIAGLSFWGLYKYFGLSLILLPYFFMAGCFIVATFVDFEHRIIPDQISLGGLIAGIIFSAFVPEIQEKTPESLNIGRLVMWSLAGLCLFLVFWARLMKKEKIGQDEIETFLIVGGIVLADVIVHELCRFKVFNTVVSNHLLSLEAAIIGFAIGGAITYLMGIIGEVIFRKEAIGGGDVKLMAMIGAFMGWKLALLTFFIAPFFGAIVGLVEFIRTRDRTIAYGPFLVLGALVSLFWGDTIIEWIMRGYLF